jgi:ribonuclease P protein component
MLPAAERVRRRAEHRLVARRGRRLRRGPLVVSLLICPASAASGSDRPRAGVVVGRRVGGAVRRNRVKRQLRELLRPQLAALPPGSLLVLRALPDAGSATFEAFRTSLEEALRTLVPARSAS